MTLRHVYPLYTLGWQSRYQDLVRYFDKVSNLYRVGRTALFLHCNLDHSILMGLGVADWLLKGRIKDGAWYELEAGFHQYYVRE